MAIVNMDLLDHKYRVVLAQLNEVLLGELAFINNVSYSPALGNIGEFSFTLPKYTTNNSGEREEVPFYNELDSDMLILIDEEEYYYINSCIETDSLDEVKKEVHAYRRDFELSLKNFNDYTPKTERFLYFIHPTDNPTHGYPWTTSLPTEDHVDEAITTTKDVEGLYYGLFNQIEEITSWRLERDANGAPVIPDSLKTEVRMITTTETNVLELFKIIQEAWNCIFTYDTINRIVKIVTREMLSSTPNGVLSDENFIINLTKDFKREEIKTRLFLYNLNGDGVVAEKMAHGHPYMENYDEFRKDKYMSTHLQNALSIYFSTLAALQAETEVLWADVKVLLIEEQGTSNLIKDWEAELISPLTTYDHYTLIQNGYILHPGTPEEVVITDPRALTENEQNRLDEASALIDDLNNFIAFYTSGVVTGYPRSLKQIDDALTIAFDALHSKQNKSLMPNVFNVYETNTGLVLGSLINEMEPYIRDATFKSDTIESADDLYNLGENLLLEISKPHLQFTINVVDFLTLVEFKDAWSLATLGQTLRVENSKLGFVDNIILLKYTHLPETNSLTFEFSNTLILQNDTTYLADLIAKSTTISSQVSFQSSYWNAGGANGTNGTIFDKLYTNAIQTNKLIAAEISAVKIETDELYAKTAEIETLVATQAVINSIKTSLIASNFGESLDLTSNTAITGLVTGKADHSDVTQASDALTIKFSKVGAKNLLKNSGFVDGSVGWSVSGTGTVTGDVAASPSGRFLSIPGTLGVTKVTTQSITAGFNQRNTLWTLSAIIANNNTTIGSTNPFVDIQLTVVYTDSTRDYISLNDNYKGQYDWTKVVKTFSSNVAKTVASFDVGLYCRDMAGGDFYVAYAQLEEGPVAHAWRNGDNESYGTTHKFTPVGYEIKDSTGATLITPNGMANEQNFGSTQNVEDGYPLNFSFRIGDSTSVITSVLLRLKQYNFRTDSKGAASGGGSTSSGSSNSTSGASSSNTSGASSKSTADSWDGGGGAAATEAPYGGYATDDHYHFLKYQDIAHVHGMAHTHTMYHTHSMVHTHTVDAHVHTVQFGILELLNENGTIDIFVDGVQRNTVTNTDIIIDISQWITTNGTHNISLVSPNMKRIQCDVFIKSYIRR